MNNIASEYIHIWHDALINSNIENLESILDENVTFFSPVVFTPLKGKNITKMYLYAAGKSFNMDKFKYIRELNDGNNSILEF